MKTVLVLALLVGAAVSRVPRNHRQRRVHKTDLWDESNDQLKERLITQKVFKAGHTYKYIYDSQALTGIPQSSERHAGSRVQCAVVCQFESEEQVNMQLHSCRVSKINRKVPSPRGMLPMRFGDMIELTSSQKEQLKQPCSFTYSKGLVQEVNFDQKDTDWSMNIKKAVLNLFQIQMDTRNVKRWSDEGIPAAEITSESHYSPNRDAFTTYEKTMEGDCLTSYTFTRQPCRRCQQEESQVLNITKSVDFERCNNRDVLRRPQANYNFRFAEPCPDNSCQKKYQDEEKFLQSSTVYRYNVTGTLEQFRIDAACAESQYVFTPYNEQGNVIVTYTNQTIVLVASGKTEKQIPKPSQVRDSKLEKSIVYGMGWDALKEQFFMDGEKREFLQDITFSIVPEPKKIAMEVVDKLRELVERQGSSHISEESPRYLAYLVKTMRMMTKEQLTELFKEVVAKTSGEQQKVARDLCVDAMGLCGTQSCLVSLIHEIKKERVNPIKGGLAIKGFAQARVVSKKMIDNLMEFAKEPICQKHSSLRQACLLTAGSMMGALCRVNQDELAVDFRLQFNKGAEAQKLRCPKSLQKQFVQELMSLFEEARQQPKEDLYEQVLVLKCLANAGMQESIVPLERIIRNVNKEGKKPTKPFTTLVRSQAIEAYRQLALVFPKSVQRVLLPIYMNQREVPEVRMMAAYQLLQTLPERPILDQIAQKTVQERSRNVRAFITTYLMSLANSTNPCEKRMADDLKLALRHARPVPRSVTPYLSRYNHRDVFNSKQRVGMGFDWGVIKSRHSTYLPRDAAASMHADIWGFWRKYMLSVGIAQQDIDFALYNLRNQFTNLLDQSPEQWQKLLKKMERVVGTSEPSKKLTELFKQLNISPRESKMFTRDLNPMAMIYLRFAGQEYGILPLNVRSLIQSLGTEFPKVKLVRWMGLVQQEQQASGSYYTGALVREISRKIPTSIGMPVTLSLMMPTILGVKKAHIKGQITDYKAEPFKLAGHVHMRAQPSIASSLMVTMEVWNPFANTGVQMSAKGQAHLPIDMKIRVDTEKEVPVKVSVHCPTSQYRKVIADFTTVPATFCIEWPEKMTRLEQLHPEVHEIVGSQWSRVKSMDKTYGEKALGIKVQVVGSVHTTPAHILPGTPMSLLSGMNHGRVIIEPGVEQPKEIVLEISRRPQESKVNFQKWTESEEEYMKPRSWETSESEELPEEFEDYQKSSESAEQFESKSKQVVLKLRAIPVEGKERMGQIKVVYHSNRSGRKFQTDIVCKGVIPQIRATTYEAKIVLQADFPTTPYMIQDLDQDKNVKLRLDCRAGPQGQMEQIGSISMQLMRSVQQQNMLENSLFHETYRTKRHDKGDSSLFSPLSQYDEIIKASSLNEMKIKVTFDQKLWESKCPACLNATNKIYRYIKYLTYQNSDVNQVNVENPKGEIRATLKLDAKNNQLLNVTCRLPKENMKVIDQPLSMPVYPMSMRPRGFSAVMDDLFFPTCRVQSSKRVTTFDQVKYKAPLTTCYSVLAKDCASAEQPKFVVLKKILQKNKHLSVVKVNDEEVSVRLQPVVESCKVGRCKKIQVKVNGEEITIGPKTKHCLPSSRQCTVQKLGPIVRVELRKPGVIVEFDGYTTDVKISPIYAGVQCGLCGHFDGDDDEEFWSADMTSQRSKAKFFRSYLDKECQLPEAELSALDDEEMYEPERYEFEESRYDSAEIDEEEPYDSSELESQESTEEGIVKATRAFRHEYDRYYCFSAEPVNSCKGDSEWYADEMDKEEKTVKFVCFEPRSRVRDLLKKKLNQARDHKRQIDVEMLKEQMPESVNVKSRNVEVTVPTSCKMI